MKQDSSPLKTFIKGRKANEDAARKLEAERAKKKNNKKAVAEEPTGDGSKA